MKSKSLIILKFSQLNYNLFLNRFVLFVYIAIVKPALKFFLTMAIRYYIIGNYIIGNCGQTDGRTNGNV